jgi:hypothetical protein
MIPQFIKTRKRKTKGLELIPCPKCKLGTAVNQSAAYAKYTSPKFVNLRTATYKLETKAKPTVGKHSHIETALRSEEFGEFIAPPQVLPNLIEKILKKLDTFFIGEPIKFLISVIFGIGLSAIVYLLYITEFDGIAGWIETYPKTITVVLTSALLLGFEHYHTKKGSAVLKKWAATWYCLRCKNHFFIDAKKNHLQSFLFNHAKKKTPN